MCVQRCTSIVTYQTYLTYKQVPNLSTKFKLFLDKNVCHPRGNIVPITYPFRILFKFK